MKKNRANILVVEDDQAILQGLLDVLIFNGYQAEGEEDGKTCQASQPPLSDRRCHSIHVNSGTGLCSCPGSR